MWSDHNSLSIVIAPKAAIGVVCASYTGRHSRLFLWDTETDTFTPGQFLKGRSVVLDISSDGRHIAYYAESFHKGAKSYVGVAHPPYYTALAFFPAFHCAVHYAKFGDNGELRLGFHEPGWWGDEVPKEPRIDPGCPYNIVTDLNAQQTYYSELEDNLHQRRVWVDGLDLYSQSGTDTEPMLLRSFPREAFISIPPPDWAKVW